ncbi:MAG: cupin domain-containing protein [Candidatus Nanopelagicales bacterium]|nr:cupin domain-containing protein [Candidatus Nanopelagicales bacterium]MDZ4249224.1 cupin domain-containing protein [Candidatus Nanopelagicales bacterium]MDZ7577709.1 cupin domain-containing protein [Candidatus Nanopelagicales bacterium]
MADAESLIRDLGLQQHPEGGWFAEIHRSQHQVTRSDAAVRVAGTLIYYLLRAGEHSTWHRVASEEIWNHVAGDPLSLYTHPGELVETVLGTPPDLPAAGVVDAGVWQAARSRGTFTLVTCAVCPGFDFADFELLSPESTDRATLAQLPGLGFLA